MISNQMEISSFSSFPGFEIYKKDLNLLEQIAAA